MHGIDVLGIHWNATPDELYEAFDSAESSMRGLTSTVLKSSHWPPTVNSQHNLPQRSVTLDDDEDQWLPKSLALECSTVGCKLPRNGNRWVHGGRCCNKCSAAGGHGPTCTTWQPIVDLLGTKYLNRPWVRKWENGKYTCSLCSKNSVKPGHFQTFPHVQRERIIGKQLLEEYIQQQGQQHQQGQQQQQPQEPQSPRQQQQQQRQEGKQPQQPQLPQQQQRQRQEEKQHIPGVAVAPPSAASSATPAQQIRTPAPPPQVRPKPSPPPKSTIPPCPPGPPPHDNANERQIDAPNERQIDAPVPKRPAPPLFKAPSRKIAKAPPPAHPPPPPGTWMDMCSSSDNPRPSALQPPSPPPMMTQSLPNKPDSPPLPPPAKHNSAVNGIGDQPPPAKPLPQLISRSSSVSTSASTSLNLTPPPPLPPSTFGDEGNPHMVTELVLVSLRSQEVVGEVSLQAGHAEAQSAPDLPATAQSATSADASLRRKARPEAPVTPASPRMEAPKRPPTAPKMLPPSAPKEPSSAPKGPPSVPKPPPPVLKTPPSAPRVPPSAPKPPPPALKPPPSVPKSASPGPKTPPVATRMPPPSAPKPLSSPAWKQLAPTCTCVRYSGQSVGWGEWDVESPISTERQKVDGEVNTSCLRVDSWEKRGIDEYGEKWETEEWGNRSWNFCARTDREWQKREWWDDEWGNGEWGNRAWGSYVCEKRESDTRNGWSDGFSGENENATSKSSDKCAQITKSYLREDSTRHAGESGLRGGTQNGAEQNQYNARSQQQEKQQGHWWQHQQHRRSWECASGYDKQWSPWNQHGEEYKNQWWSRDQRREEYGNQWWSWDLHAQRPKDN
eukprot:GEMP01013366.1.p1 GENE.GEMP01013366.1~~GEMP01013366.1.p1  ORF type:complete len:838 (+),score=237.72 GEMP01013366.1:226-2739(+)